MPQHQYRRLAEAIEALRARGYRRRFEVVNGRLRVAETGVLLAPEDVTVQEHHRFEGTSDPDDLSVVYAVESRSGERGLIVDTVGVRANPALGDLLLRARHEDSG